MKQSMLAIFIIFASILGILVLNSAYTIDETEQVVITQFGEPIGAAIQQAGLHWKTPFVQVAHKFEKRILEWDGYPSQVVTRDKKSIGVDITARWRIEDALKYFQTMHNERNAQSRLDDIMDGIARNNISRYDLPEIVRNSNRLIDLEEAGAEDDISTETGYDKIKVGRDEITRLILHQAREIIREYGIELIDIRIRRINYIESVQRKVYERMISERKRAAEELRSEGQGIRAEIEGQKEKELKSITSDAYRKAQKIKGEADAEATKIYGDAYSKDPEFYAFISTLEAYPETLKKADLILSTDSEFFKYLKKLDAQ